MKNQISNPFMINTLILTKAVSSIHENIDISRLQSGLYLVNVSGYIARFIKE